ncbi:nucleoside deaminase [Methylopila sp. 73B]|uniref:nucleoside deaminase n=1 Tax=Methylopila sp. 73B TaxID=1120792 RepID=UPI00038284E6|nr:nucleoside deaminase [Methylopila sp. 73B]
MSDRELLARAVELSRTHSEAGEGGPFGAVVATPDGRVVAEGWNQVLSHGDPTAHAEVVAIRRAAEALGTHVLTGHVMYASCEPCPMCLAAVAWARMDRIVFANSRHDAARIGFDDAKIYEEIGRPLDQRWIACERVEMPEAEAVFNEWLARNGTIY